MGQRVKKRIIYLIKVVVILKLFSFAMHSGMYSWKGEKMNLNCWPVNTEMRDDLSLKKKMLCCKIKKCKACIKFLFYTGTFDYT